MTQKKLKKRLFALLAAAMLVASQTGAVCATGLDVSPVTAVTESSAAEENSSAEATESTKETEEVQGETSETAAEKQTEQGQENAGAGEAETTGAEETIPGEETAAETATGGETETTGVKEGSEAGITAETTVTTETTAIPETTVTTETTAGAKKVFTDKNGEEVVPESLIGVNYDTVSENYDGETNVIKQFELSDEYDANTIMDSYVDEDGNLIMIISQGAEKAVTMGLEAATADSLDSDSDSPAIDGSFSGWDDIPVSYEFNWNKPAGENGPNTETHHAMQLYKGSEKVKDEKGELKDEEYVYLNVTYAAEYGSHANSECYEFYVDGETVRYQVTWPEGSVLTNSNPEQGTYEVNVRHGGGSCSWSFANGSKAYYKVNEGNINNQMELKIPLSEFEKQLGKKLDNYAMIQMFNPNLMHDRISCAGSPTGSIPFAAVAFTLVPASCMWIKKKKR